VVRVTLLALLVSIAGCGAATVAPEARATIRFSIEPTTARVYNEDRFVGSAAVLTAQPPTFPTGPRQFTVTADGYFPVDFDIDLAAGTTREVTVHMVPIPR
jgi:hypothetical protein